ncbi:M56 family metallopeptidase [Olivibacter jilunii]|uniref:M56 family metallopeptidase n=1 Tax=Olivibacter jilunii TaxID=985016 RepID=UPI003F1684C5
MMNYLIIANIYLILFYGFYRFFLARETFFQLNRIYLVGTVFLSFIFPLIHLEWLQNTFGSSTVFVARSSLDAVTIDMTVNNAPSDTMGDIHISILGYIYISGFLVQLALLIRKLVQLRRRLKTNNRGDAYSFMHMIKVDDGQEGSPTVLRHELVHVQQLHTLDILLLEVVKLFNWFNPVVYWLTNSLKLTHEYIADEAINASRDDKIAYAELLISRTFSVSSSVLTNNFLNQSFIKSRIVMLLKDKSKRSALLKYVLAVPLFAAMLIFSSAKVNDKELAHINADQKEGLKLPNEWEVKQDSIKKNVVDFNKVEKQPEFPGGLRAFYNWVGEHYKYPAEAKKNGIAGTLHVRFIVELDGSLSEIEVYKDLGSGTGEAAVELLEASPKWAPGLVDGKPVRVSYSLPIKLNLSKSKQKEQVSQTAAN